ncbi:MAG: hypothetical protein K6B68_13080, partial [Eubacterium sp.]|nr:hypothetical protein [Eubacterium sp.]
MVNAMEYENNLINKMSLFEGRDYYMVPSVATANRRYNDLEIRNRFIKIENLLDYVCLMRNQRLKSPLLEFLG